MILAIHRTVSVHRAFDQAPFHEPYIFVLIKNVICSLQYESQKMERQKVFCFNLIFLCYLPSETEHPRPSVLIRVAESYCPEVLCSALLGLPSSLTGLIHL